MEFQQLPLLIISTGVWELEGKKAAIPAKEMLASNRIRGYSIVPGDQILSVIETTPPPIVVVIKDTAYSAQLVEKIVSLKKDPTGIDVVRVKYSADATQASSLHSKGAEHFVGPADLWDVVARTIEKHLPVAKGNASEELEAPPTRPQPSEKAQSVLPQSDGERTETTDISESDSASEERKAKKEPGGWFARLRETLGERKEKPSLEHDRSTPAASTTRNDVASPAGGVPIILTYKTIYVVATRNEIEAAQEKLGHLSRLLTIREVPVSLVTSNLALRPAVVVIGPRNVLDASGIMDGDLVRVLICDERGMDKYVADLPEGKVVRPSQIPVEIANAIKHFLKML